jgi:hypothetical protein
MLPQYILELEPTPGQTQTNLSDLLQPTIDLMEGFIRQFSEEPRVGGVLTRLIEEFEEDYTVDEEGLRIYFVFNTTEYGLMPHYAAHYFYMVAGLYRQEINDHLAPYGYQMKDQRSLSQILAEREELFVEDWIRSVCISIFDGEYFILNTNSGRLRKARLEPEQRAHFKEAFEERRCQCPFCKVAMEKVSQGSQ